MGRQHTQESKMHPMDFVDDINERIERYVGKMECYNADQLGMDIRAGYHLYVDKDYTCIMVSKYDDRVLQYYGGFEYVDKEARTELGDWVFYMAEDSRVARCLEHLQGKEELEEDEEEA